MQTNTIKILTKIYINNGKKQFDTTENKINNSQNCETAWLGIK